MFLSPCGGARRIHAVSRGRHLAIPGKAGQALPHHVAMGSPNELILPHLKTV